MIKKLLIFLIFILAINGLVFADESDLKENIKEYFPRNTITIDTLPTFGSLLITTALNDTIHLNNYVLITSLQYEYQINSFLSLATRLGIRQITSEIDYLEITTLSAEEHIRVYPSQGKFFLDWMFGYSYLKMTDLIDYNFLTYGGRLGWRIAFGNKKPGGFILEPSIGYIGALGINESFTYEDPTTKYMIQQYLVGGFVLSVGMGYRF